MRTKAVRLHGQNDLRLEEFELPKPGNEEILARVVSDSICMSTYKATTQGGQHKRVPETIAEKPVIIGHEFCGEILEVGDRWRHKFGPGQRFSIQPAVNYKPMLDGMGAAGYSYQHLGGNATHVLIPSEFIELGCLLVYEGEAFYLGSLAEPMSCIVGTFHAHYHTEKYKYEHHMGIVNGGKMAILAGAGPMGLGAIDYALHNEHKRPSLLTVTDIDEARLERAASILTKEEAKRHGVELHYVNTAEVAGPVEQLRALTGGDGYDDVLVFAPVPALFEQGDRILGFDGCLNFFAGPTDPKLTAKINLYEMHYSQHHVVGTSGGNSDDMVESLELMSTGKINPSAMITHVGGLNAVIDTTMTLPRIPGGKKLIYTNTALELTAIDDFKERGKFDPLFAALAEIVERHNGLWSPEAERYLLDRAPPV